MTERRKDPRSITINYQERRRNAALEQQSSARAKALDARRRITDLIDSQQLPELAQEQQPNQQTRIPDDSEVAQPSGEDAGSVGAGSTSRDSTRLHWASQLMLPEWLVEIPPDLATNWYVLPRPEGQRCLVVSSKGQTIARARNGVLLEIFASQLPGGGTGTRGADLCILDCIYHSDNHTYYVIGENLYW